MTRWLTVTVLLVSPVGVRADVGLQISSYVPHDHIIEVAGDVSAYRFFVRDARGDVVPVPLAAGQNYQLTWDGPLPRFAVGRVIVAVPHTSGKEPAPEEVAEMIRLGSSPPGVQKLTGFPPAAAVPPYDSRSRVVSRYRLEVAPGGELRLTELGQNRSSPVPLLIWLTAGLAAFALVVWVGWRLVRRGGGRSPAPGAPNP
jgi:hypothetical protein